MSPTVVLLILRILLAGLLYGFLAMLMWTLWRDLRASERAVLSRSHRLGRLVVVETGGCELATGTAFSLLPVTSLGRAPTNVVTLPDDTISLEHALLYLRDGRLWLEDLGSRNGTRLNENVITSPAPVVAGDVIGIGKVRLKIELE